MPGSSNNLSPLHSGAHGGIFLGIYLSVIFGLQVAMQWYPQVSIIATIAIFAFPLVLYRRLRISYVRGGCGASYGDLFAQGVLSVLGGAIVSCLVSVVYIRFFQPTYVTDLLDGMVLAYTQAGIPLDDPAVAQLTYMRESGALPAGTELCILISSSIVIFGTILSIAAAALACRPLRRTAAAKSE